MGEMTTIPQQAASAVTEIKDMLSAHPLFTHFTPEEINALIKLCIKKHFKKDSLIVKEGDIVDAVYFIISGTAEVQKLVTVNDMMTAQPIATLTKGESIGLSESGFFSLTGTRTATVVATSALITLALDLSKFRDFLTAYPHSNTAIRDNADIMLRMHFIKQTTPFAQLSLERLRYFAEQIQEVSLHAGDILFHQGDNADNSYLIRTGKMEILIQHEEDAPKKIAELEAPALFGESALLLEMPRNATAHALTDCTLFAINKKLFLEMIGSETSAAQAIMELQKARCRPIQCQAIEAFHSVADDGEKVITLRNATLGSYFRTSEEGWFIWKKLDGMHTIHDLTMDFYEQYDVFNPGEVSSFIVDLKQAGFVKLDIKELAAAATPPSKWLKFFLMINRIMTANIVLGQMDDFLTTSYNKVMWIFFTRPAQYLFVLLTLLGLSNFIYQWHHAVKQMNVLSNKSILIILAMFALMCTFVLHELAHAYATKYFNRRVYAFGVGWFWFGPMAFCDTSDMWLSARKPRIIVDMVGIYLNAILAGIASLCMLVNISAELNVFLWLFSLASYSLIITNLSPLIELDGYYALMDIFDKPNLREVSIAWFASLFSKTAPKLPLAVAIKEHKMEFSYWVICVVYTIVSILFSSIVAVYLMRGLFGINNPYVSILLTLIVVLISSIGIWSKLAPRN